MQSYERNKKKLNSYKCNKKKMKNKKESTDGSSQEGQYIKFRIAKQSIFLVGTVHWPPFPTI